MKKKLYKDRANEMIAGVCSGIANYFNVDATIIRIIWALAILCAGTGLLAYIVCAIIMPDKPSGYSEVDYESCNNANIGTDANGNSYGNPQNSGSYYTPPTDKN